MPRIDTARHDCIRELNDAFRKTLICSKGSPVLTAGVASLPSDVQATGMRRDKGQRDGDRWSEGSRTESSGETPDPQPRGRSNNRSIFAAMMKSFSCRPLIFLVCKETVAYPQPKLTSG